MVSCIICPIVSLVKDEVVSGAAAPKGLGFGFPLWVGFLGVLRVFWWALEMLQWASG